MSVLLEVRSAIRRATKEDLFVGDINNVHGKQSVKENVTLFYRNLKTGLFSGPKIISSNAEFVNLYCQMNYGMLGVLTAVPEVVVNEYLFELVLREATAYDLQYTLKHIRMNRIYYTYTNKVLLGPFYTNNGSMHETLTPLLAKKEIFVPNERQHFKKKNSGRQ